MKHLKLFNQACTEVGWVWRYEGFPVRGVCNK